MGRRELPRRALVTQSQAYPGGSCSYLSWDGALDAAQDATQDARSGATPGVLLGAAPMEWLRQRSERLHLEWGAVGEKQPSQWHVIRACASHSPEGT